MFSGLPGQPSAQIPLARGPWLALFPNWSEGKHWRRQEKQQKQDGQKVKLQEVKLH